MNPRSQGSALRVLVVDEDAEARALLRERLATSPRPITVTEAQGVEPALASAAQDSLDAGAGPPGQPAASR